MPASTITTAFTRQYAANVYLLSQQLGSKMQGRVRTETVSGAEDAAFDRLGEVEAQLITSRHGDTPNNEQAHTRRWATPADYNTASFLDNQDKLKSIIEPASDFARTQAAALGRTKDNVIITAALGAATVDKTGSATVDFKDESISIGGDAAGAVVTTLGTLAAVGTVADFDLGKMLVMMQLFNQEDVDPDIQKHWMISPKSLADMLDLTEVGSADYNTVKALTEGKVDSFMGFSFFWSNRITKDAATSTAYRSIAWAQDGLILAQAEDLKSRMDERPDKNYTVQIYSEMSIGAVRLEGAKVHECLNQVA
jgi:hypothetical protein